MTEKIKLTLKLIMVGFAIPFAIAASLAFSSFIYEEALQAAGFAVKATIAAEDQALALQAVKNFEQIMKDAMQFQDRWGCMAFWSHKAYATYFGRAAPMQLLGFYADGRRAGLWGDDVRRWQEKDGVLVDTWADDAVRQIIALGFRPELLKNKWCQTCAESHRYEKKSEAWIDKKRGKGADALR